MRVHRVVVHKLVAARLVPADYACPPLLHAAQRLEARVVHHVVTFGAEERAVHHIACECVRLLGEVQPNVRRSDLGAVRGAVGTAATRRLHHRVVEQACGVRERTLIVVRAAGAARLVRLSGVLRTHPTVLDLSPVPQRSDIALE